MFALFVTVYGDITHLYDAPRASEVNLIRHQLDAEERPLLVQRPQAFQPPVVSKISKYLFILMHCLHTAVFMFDSK